MKKYNVIIIGGGASGCMVAMTAKEKSVAIIDSGKTLAKKIMATGNGRCNLTNVNMGSQFFNQNIDRFLTRFNERETLNFFEDIGLETYSDEEGRVYPISNSAKSVVDVITAQLNGRVDAILEEKVISIKKIKDGFEVETDKNKFQCNKLVVASGGNTLMETVKTLGVKVKNTAPSLVALKCSEIKDLNGVKVSNVKVTVTNANGESKSEIGEVLFKDGGVSGIVVFNLSTMFSRINDFTGRIVIDLLPNLSLEEVTKKILKRKSLGVSLSKVFVGMFANAVANEIFRQSKVNTNIPVSKLSNEQAKHIAEIIKNLTFTVCGYYDNNQVFSGGVDLSSLDNNLMSKTTPNLYFTGEICDIDAVCGGYNLQWAWTSGKIVGDNL